MVYNIAVAVIIKGTKQWDYFKGHQILPQARDNWLSPLPKIYVRPSNSECVCIHKEGHYRGDWLAMMSCEWALIQSLWHPEEKKTLGYSRKECENTGWGVQRERSSMGEGKRYERDPSSTIRNTQSLVSDLQLSWWKERDQFLLFKLPEL